MPEKIRGITIELGGDATGLNKALKEVDKELSNTGKQLKDVERLLKLDPTNVDLLKQKQKLLSDQIETTKSKLDSLEKAQRRLKDNNVDETSDQYMALQREIIATKNGLNALQKEADKNDDALENIGDSSQTAARGIKKEDAQAKKAKGSNQKLTQILLKSAKAFSAIAKTAASAFVNVAKSLSSMAGDTAQYADELLTLEKISGISTDTLQELSYASELLDVDLDSITTTLKKNTQAMAKAADGNMQYAEIYDMLGVNILDANGNLRASEEVYWEVIDALGKMDNATERDAIAMELLGKSATELNPIIKTGSEGMKALAEEAHETGYVMTHDVLESYNDYQDTMDKLSNSVTALKNAMGRFLLPILKKLATTGTSALNKFTKALSGADGDISKLSAAIGETLADVVAEIVTVIPDVLSTVGSIFTQIIGVVVNNLPKILNTVNSVLIQVVQQLAANLPMIISSISDALNSILTALVDELPGIAKAVLEGILIIINSIVDELPVLVDGVFDLILKMVEMLLNLDWATTITNILTTIFDIVFNKLPQFLNDLVKTLITNLPKFLMNIVEAVPDIIESLLTSVIDSVFNSMFSLLDFTSFLSKMVENIDWNSLGKKFANLGIRIVNAIISGLNKLGNFTIPGFSIGSWKLWDDTTVKLWNIPSIPLLAKGGTFSSGSAIVGDAGPELLTMSNGAAKVTPLTNNTTNNYYGAGDGSGNITINFTGSLAQLARLLQPEIEAAGNRVGGTLIGVGAK